MKSRGEYVARIYLILSAKHNDNSIPIFYVGETTRSLRERLDEHIKETFEFIEFGKEPTAKKIFFSKILKNGIGLRIIELSVVKRKYRFAAEREWIDFLRSRGIRLVNGSDRNY